MMHTRATVLFALVTAIACNGGVEPPPSPNGDPVVNAGVDGTVMVGEPYALTASFSDDSTDGPWSYTIAWGDGAIATGSRSHRGPFTATHVYALDADYQVRVTLKDRRGGQGSDQAVVRATGPVLLAAGDIGDCIRDGDNQTADLLEGLAGIVVPLGDNAYLSGTPEQFATCYAPTWGRHLARTRPVAGNHDYYTEGAAGYFGYFGAAAGDPTKGYYSYTLGAWTVIVLNTGTEKSAFIAAGSAQEQWLRAELAAAGERCVLALWHHPRFTAVLGRANPRPEVKALWDALYEFGADLVVNGHDHAYLRFGPQTPDGVVDAQFGIPQITVGTGGGEGLYDMEPVAPPNLLASNNDTFGVLTLTLRRNGFDWRFLPVAGKTYTDAGTGTCHGRPS